ncbi:MAG TPA: hypothetical protein DDZ89_11130 [Clostridiales bacterium]|nr:hypothetical protein [Clostridiales bacterium]
MKNMKKPIIVGIVVFSLVLVSITTFAASQYGTPAEAIAGLSGREVQSVIDERAQTGKTYGTIAKEAGILDQFKVEVLQMKKDIVAARVAAGTLTKEQADAIIAGIENNQENCDGTGISCGQNGAGFGARAGFGQGNRQGRGQQGRGMGNALRNGSCGR